MAPLPVHEPPHHQLSRLAEGARRRGVSFEAFWREAIRPERPQIMVTNASPPAGCVRWPTDPRERKAWRTAIIGTKESWRRAYELVEPRVEERALAELSVEFSLLDRLAVERQRREMDALPAQDALPSAA